MTIVPGDVLANVRAADLWAWRFDVAQAGQARGQGRVADHAADGQRLLLPAHQRDHLPGGHPAAAVLRSERRRRGELRRHRQRDRPRDRPRLRRPGPALRRHRHARRTGGPRPTATAFTKRSAGLVGAVRRVRGAARSQGERTADARREHRRPRRPRRGLPGVPAVARRQGRRRSSTASPAISASSWPTARRGARRCATRSCARWCCPIRTRRR